MQETIDLLIEQHGRKLLVSVSMTILNDEQEPEVSQLMQWGIRDGLLLMLKTSIERTENETEFVGRDFEPVTFN